MYDLKFKRIYEPVSEEDGFRILIDRLWPRGVSKEKADVDHWAKGLTPSEKLRKDYHQERIDHDTFAARYRKELSELEKAEDGDIADVRVIKDKLAEGPVTCLTAVKNLAGSHVPTLEVFLRKKLS